MWWKVYFLLDIVLLGISVLSFFSPDRQNILTHIFLIVTYCIALVGLYFYAFRKPILYQQFWKIYFWFYLILDIVYFVWGFLPVSVTKFISFLSVYNDDTYWDSVINTALDIPLLYALFSLSKGNSYEPHVKKKNSPKNRFQWGMIQMAFWGYSSVVIFFLFILAFFPPGGSGNAKDVSDSAYLSVVFAPLLIFWLWILVQYKRYKWNWWRMTLIANALLYSGFIIFGLLFPQPQQTTSGGLDFIGIFQLLILLISLYVFGKDQFILAQNKK